ncbi:MAG: TIGR03560 family F420-dependent LLM class oxidoreductase [Candidatus Bathyarchaeia archaeon]
MYSLDFGIQIEPQYGFDYGSIEEIALDAEELGFESIWVSDHFFMTHESIGTNCLECWTTLTALAQSTTEIRLGPMVSSQSYRNPALMANIAASLDNISGGRVNYGIGAGWKEVEYRAYGYEYPRALTRIKQLEEAIVIAKGLWTEDKATYQGQHYEVREALCYPHSIQEPHIPIWVGGTRTHTLRVTAEHADAVNFAWTIPPDRFEDRLKVLLGHCDEVGRNYDEIKKSAGVMITMAPDRAKLEEKLERQRENRDTPYRRYLSKQPPNMIGTPDEVAEGIETYKGLGVDHFILRFNFGGELESMRLFMDEVYPAI